MRKVHIEWQHYDKEGETCARCDTTGQNIQKAINSISGDRRFRDAAISFTEIKLGADEMEKSNIVLIDGIPIENILGGTVSDNYCHSCTCLAGKSTNCRTIKLGTNNYEDIPEAVIKDALLETLKGN